MLSKKNMTASVNIVVIVNYLAWLVIVNSVLSVAGSNVRVLKGFTTLRGDGFKLLPEHVTKQVLSADLVACTAECVRLSDCMTASWNAHQRACLLSGTDVTNDFKENAALIDDSAWNTISKKKYTVFGARPLFQSPSLTFDQAKDLCIERHTTLASYTELWYSRRLGYDFQQCCWLSEGTIGYAIQSESYIITCTPSSNPWALCILN